MLWLVDKIWKRECNIFGEVVVLGMGKIFARCSTLFPYSEESSVWLKPHCNYNCAWPSWTAFSIVAIVRWTIVQTPSKLHYNRVGEIKLFHSILQNSTHSVASKTTLFRYFFFFFRSPTLRLLQRNVLEAIRPGDQSWTVKQLCIQRFCIMPQCSRTWDLTPDLCSELQGFSKTRKNGYFSVWQLILR